MDPFKVSIEVEVSSQDVDDILCAAFEGGIGYWCDEVVVDGKWPEGATYASEALSRGATLKLKDAEPEDDTDGYFTLTLDMFKKGLATYVAKHGWSGDTGDIDADAADSIVQYALFGKIVFG